MPCPKAVGLGAHVGGGEAGEASDCHNPPSPSGFSPVDEWPTSSRSPSSADPVLGTYVRGRDARSANPSPVHTFHLGPPASQAYCIPATPRRGEGEVQPTRQQQRNLFPRCCRRVYESMSVHDGSSAPIYPRRWVPASQSPVPVSCPAVRADRLSPRAPPPLPVLTPRRPRHRAHRGCNQPQTKPLKFSLRCTTLE